jgi:hypothetical protein
MRSAIFTRTLLLAPLAFFLASFAHAQDAWHFPDFSATQVFQSRKAEITMKVYRSGSSVRVERTRAMSTLYVPAKKTIYNFTVYPNNSRQCVSMTPEQAKMLPSPLELIQGKIVKRTLVGHEVVEGHASKVEKVVVARSDGKTIKSKVWEAQDLKGVPVKIESYLTRITLTAVYRDVVIGAPDQALFTVPDRCTPFEKMYQVAESRIVK